MSAFSRNDFFHRTFTRDDLSNNSQCKNVKFKRAFQFLHLLLLQRAYGIDVIRRSSYRRTSKRQSHNQCEVFLGGSCNPTTWRCEQAIPYFQSRSISYYNPQVADWTPELIEIEHRAKELAPLLFFVIDHNTRSLAAIAEVCYLTARRRNIIIMMSSMPDEKSETKFIQQKYNSPDDEHDYENVCEARRTLRRLLQSINLPVFDNIRVALEFAAFILETTKQTVIHSNIIDEDKTKDESERDTCTVYDSPEDFYHHVNQLEMIPSSPIASHRRHSATINHSLLPSSPFLHSNHLPAGVRFCRTSICTKAQISRSTNESDDDGYGSLLSSNRTLSQSSSSIFSDVYDASTDENMSSRFYQFIAIVNNIISSIFTHSLFLTPPILSNASLTQSLFLLYKQIQKTCSPSVINTITVSEEDNILFDLYIASDDYDEYWLDTCALPLLDEINVRYTKRQAYHENDQLDILYDIHIRKRSRLLYYLINDQERLSYLTTELAFLIGERQYHIIVCLQLTIDETSEKILTKNERKDIERSRKYLEDIAKKEKILLCHSREQSWQHVLAFFLQN